VIDPTSGTGTDTTNNNLTLTQQGYTATTIIADYIGKKWFQVPAHTTGIMATLTINGLDNSGKLIVRNGGDSSSAATNNTIMIGGGTGKPTFTSTTLVGDGAPLIAAAAAAGTKFTFDIVFATTASGEFDIYFNIPVVGFGKALTTIPTGSTQIPWNIRGGYITGSIDFDGTTGNEAVPLLVTLDADTVEVDVGAGPFTPNP